jgi:hypothetical protein
MAMRLTSGIAVIPPCAVAQSAMLSPPKGLSMKNGRVSKIPLADPHQVGAVAQGFIQNAGEGGFAPQGVQSLGRVGKLEDAALAGLAVHRQPDIPGAARAQGAIQAPSRAIGDRIARLESEGEPGALRRRAQLDGHADAVADAVNRLDDGAPLITQGGPQLRDRGGQRLLNDSAVLPDDGQKLLLSDHIASAGQKGFEQEKRLGLDQAYLAADAELAP